MPFERVFQLAYFDKENVHRLKHNCAERIPFLLSPSCIELSNSFILLNFSMRRVLLSSKILRAAFAC